MTPDRDVTRPTPEELEARVQEGLTDLWATTPTLAPNREDHLIHADALAALSELRARAEKAEAVMDAVRPLLDHIRSIP